MHDTRADRTDDVLPPPTRRRAVPPIWTAILPSARLPMHRPKDRSVRSGPVV